jgi:hypothetical protein
MHRERKINSFRQKVNSLDFGALEYNKLQLCPHAANNKSAPHSLKVYKYVGNEGEMHSPVKDDLDAAKMENRDRHS